MGILKIISKNTIIRTIKNNTWGVKVVVENLCYKITNYKSCGSRQDTDFLQSMEYNAQWWVHSVYVRRRKMQCNFPK